MKENICKIDDCCKKSFRTGLCRQHYRKSRPVNRTCSIDGCEKPHDSHGLCDLHARRYRKYGDPNYIKKYKSETDICLVDGCSESYYSKGYCKKHYTRSLNHGDPEITIIEMHGLSKTPEYKLWVGMVQRCYYKKHKFYNRYGGRGISMSERWRKSFLSFFDDMGERPSKKHELDRINNDGNYEASNCRWTDHTTNIRNSTVAKLNVKSAKNIKDLIESGHTDLEISKFFNVTPATIYDIRHERTWIDV